MRGGSYEVFCTLKFREKIDELGLIFGFGLSSIFMAVFWVFFNAIEGLSWFLRCFIGVLDQT